RRRHTRFARDWSSDVCSSDLEDARGLGDAAMQALARQFNLSETTFVLPSERATARVRIFTPSYEMPCAGHPTLGTAHVVRSLAEIGRASVEGEGVGLGARRSW